MNLGKVVKETRYEPIAEPVPSKEEEKVPARVPEKEPVPA